MLQLDLIEVLSSTSSLVFAFWPLLILYTVQARRNSLIAALVAWSIFALARVAMLLTSVPTFSFLFPDPLNTILFILSGVILASLIVFTKYRRTGNTSFDLRNYTGPEDLMSLSPGEFEDLTVELFELRGYKARRTGTVGDHGVDVEVRTKGGEKWIVQCKRWRSSVGEPVVRDFYGVMHHEKAAKGVLIVTSDFTDQAIRWAKGKPMILIDGRRFVKYMKQARRQQSAGLSHLS